MEETIQFFIRKPDKNVDDDDCRKGKRSTYSIVERKFRDGRRIADIKKKDNRIDAINKKYLANKMGSIEAEKAIKQVKVDLEKEAGIYFKAIFNSDNLELLEQFWEYEYSDRELVDENSAYCDFRRAIEALGEKSLIASSKKELESQVNQSHQGEKQRRIVSRLNQLLKYLGRNITLRKVKPEVRRVGYLTESEFRTVLTYIDDPALCLFFMVAFYTGVRMGEAFGVDARCILNDSLRVDQQLDIKGVTRQTKNRKIRLAYTFPQIREHLKEWVKVKFEIKYSRTNITKIFQKACFEAFPDDKSKHCTVHDLRHSYAIMLLSKGVSISHIAQSLGNSVSVCEQYYTGFVLTSESIDFIDQTVRKAS